MYQMCAARADCPDEGLQTGPLLQECDRKQQLHALLKPVLPHNSLEEWRSGQPLVCIDFGSMGCMGLIADPHHLVAVLVAALHIAGAKGILLTGIWLLPLPSCCVSARKNWSRLE